MKSRDLDPKIDYSFFSSEDMLEPVQDAINRGHELYLTQSLQKELAKEGLTYNV